MPKVSDDYREERRMEIALAALAVARRRGFTKTTMADVIAELDSSAGSVYSNFKNKAEMTHYVAGVILEARVAELQEIAALGGTPAPLDLLEAMLTGALSQNVLFDVVMQIWSESITEPTLGVVIQDLLLRMRLAMREAVLPWARLRSTSEEQAESLADRSSFVIVALAQGFITNTALQGPLSPTEYVAGLRSFYDT
ncbi:TetR/AcrR family transcriptional regulator [Leucobacter viscericola]|uniref:TetR/AcrR family transcriptional regulator n=1 Tax=Leucobacter viscericola TaxID=2714935 RepID=A0A6G7XC18_9MICO|nr:TetR/AcrR family transcriptional regulator [Leucobacter viscericola]QIK62103.1 TetR/AcrR family transcriptional regulator [Leucobacter viscericola]